MITHITREQREALEASHGIPVEVFDAERNQRYYLLPAALFESLKSTLDLNESTADQRTSLLQAWGKSSGWEEPGDSVFDDLEPAP